MRIANLMVQALLCTLLLGFCGNALFGQGCEQMLYQHQNQIDPKPIEVGQVRGTGLDPTGVAIPRLCIGIFSETEHKLLRFVQGDNNGVFALDTNSLPNGDYRLVVQAIGFCPANAIIRINSRSHGKRSLVAKMRLSAIDTCSFIEIGKN